MKHIFLITVLTATPALAECPVDGDLATGIRIVESEGLTSIFVQQSDDIVEQIGKYDDGYAFRTMLVHGTHVLQLADLENGAVLPDTIINTAYPSSPAELPIPTANSQWEIDTVIRFSDGDIYAEKQSQVWGDPFEWTIAECTYTAIPGEISYVSEDGTITEGVYYVPEIKMAYLHSYEDDYDGLENFTALRIEAVR